MIYKDIEYDVTNSIPNLHPFVDYWFEDKSIYTKANTLYKDKDNDFLIGTSNGILMNIDFVFVNTELFSEVSTFYENSAKNELNKYYCPYKKGTIEYINFWKRETKRRRYGHTELCKLSRTLIPEYNAAKTDEERRALLQPLRITGDHYHYLNYSRIHRNLTSIEKQDRESKGDYKTKKRTAFPQFFDGDYWTFKVDEFVTINGFNLCKGKARRKGYSYKKGANSANTVNLNPNINVLIAAGDDRYLTDTNATSAMIKRNLDWLEQKTYWKRGFLKEDLSDIQLGYKKEKTGHQAYGWLSGVLSVTCKSNTSALVGKDAAEIAIEEAGVFPNLKETMDVTMSATESGDEKVGRIDWYGTGGTKGSNWEDFKDIFYNPNAYGALPMENIWDANARSMTCGYFHPQILCYQPHMDSYGNSYITKSFIIDELKKKKAQTNLSIDSYVVYCSQRANSPSEAFNYTHENLFSSVELNEHIKHIQTIESSIVKRDGDFVFDNGTVRFKNNFELESINIKIHPYITSVPFTSKDDPIGCWRIYNEPIRVNGTIPDDLYYIVVDPFGKDKSIKEISTKNSLSAIYVLSYPTTFSHDSSIVMGDIIQAVYVGRDEDTEGTSRRCKAAAMYYNAKVLAETDRGTIVQDFKRWSLTHYLIKNPMASVNEKVNNTFAADYGVTAGTGERVAEFMINLKKWLYTPINNVDGNTRYLFHYINDLPTLLEFQRFTIKGNFDRLAALRLAPINRMVYLAKALKPNTSITNGKTLLGELRMYQH